MGSRLRHRRAGLRGTALAGLGQGEGVPPPPYVVQRAHEPAAGRASFLNERRLGAPTWLWIVGGLVGVAGIVFIRRKDLTMAFDFAKGAAFKAVLAASERDAVPHADHILQASQAEDVTPFITVALGKRESNWARSLDADLTGDYTARTGSWLKAPGVKVVSEGDLPTKWIRPRDGDGNVIPGPYAIPEDGLGWGRGVMQVDWPRARAEKHNWRDHLANIRLGLRIYKEKVKELSAAPSGAWTIGAGLAKTLGVMPGTYPAKAVPPDLVPVAALAAYNAGAAAVRRAYSAAGQQGIDRITTGKDYATKVAGTIVALTNAFNNATGTQA